MDGRSECEEIRDSREVFDLYCYIYIYIYICHLSNLLIFLFINVHYTIVYRVKILLYSLCLMFVTSAEVLPWQLGIILQMAPIHEANTSRQPSESVCALDSASRIASLISFATAIRDLNAEEKVAC